MLSVFFRLTRFRLKAEWLLLIFVLILMVLYTWFCGLDVRGTSVGSFEMFSHKYSGIDPRMLAKSLGLDAAPEGADMWEIYHAALRDLRGFAYSRILMGAENCAMLLMDALAVLLLCSLFQKRRLGQFLAAGCSRGQVFLSLTLTYFCCVAALWLAASVYLLSRYHIAFAPEEQAFFRVTQLSWLCSAMFSGSLAYLSAFLLRRPLPAFLAALGVWFILRLTAPDLSVLPVIILGSGVIKSWDPGMDTSSLAAGNWITLGVFALCVLLAWFSFRKRGFE